MLRQLISLSMFLMFSGSVYAVGSKPLPPCYDPDAENKYCSQSADLSCSTYSEGSDRQMCIDSFRAECLKKQGCPSGETVEQCRTRTEPTCSEIATTTAMESGIKNFLRTERDESLVCEQCPIVTTFSYTEPNARKPIFEADKKSSVWNDFYQDYLEQCFKLAGCVTKPAVLYEYHTPSYDEFMGVV